ncbi:hypothetical protein UlMin_028152 [Ulmus minor]
MDAVWNLEDKCKLSTKQALTLFLFAAFAIAGVCAGTTVLRIRNSNKTRRSPPSNKELISREDNVGVIGVEWPPEETKTMSSCGWGSIKRALMGSMRWSRARKWSQRGAENIRPGSWRETPLPLLDPKRRNDHDHHNHHHHDHNSESPVWQRPILMGEKCQLPRFSGLILYDENGQLLCDARKEADSCNLTTNKVEKGGVVRQKLRDFLY